MAGNEIRIRSWLKDEVSGKVDRIKDKFDHLGKSGGFKAFVQGVGMGAGIAAMNMMGQAARGAADFIGDSINASRDLSETLQKSGVVFGDSAQKVEDWGDTAAKSIGVSKLAAIEAAATFGNFFVGLGQTGAEAAKLSMKVVGLAGDLASFNNMDPNEVLDKLRSGLAGEAEPLRRMGVFLTEAKVKAKAMEMGLAGAHGELTEGAKVMARYQIILDETGTAQGDFARTSEGLANKQRTASAMLIDAQARLGSAFEPMALQVTEWQEDFILGMGVAGGALDELATGISDFLDFITPWDEYMTVAEEKAIGMAERSAAAIRRYMAGAAKDDLYTAGEAATDMADKWEDAADDAETSYRDLVDALSEDTSQLIDDVHDPAILYAEYRTIQEGLAAEERVTQSKESTREEIKDAERRKLRLEKEADETRLALLESGSLTVEDTDKWLRQLEKEYRTSTGRARAQLALLIAKIKELAHITAKGIDIQIRGLPGSGIGSGGGKRAAGGPVDPNKVYMVGEKGPELFVSDTAGTIIPNHRLTGDIGSGGGDVIQLIVNGGLRMDEDGLMTTVERMRAIARGRKVA